jgi:phosphate starvation-inducible PhoH-like protein
MGKKKNFKIDQDLFSDESIAKNTVNNNKIIPRVKIKCKNEKQKQFLDCIDENQITICNGPAGTGKSHLAVLKAIDYIQRTDNEYHKIYLLTPIVEVGGINGSQSMGFLPGDVNSKIFNYLQSSYYLIDKIIGKDAREKMMNDKIIEPLAFAYIRGYNLDSCVIIGDEIQNCSVLEIKTLLTRIGYNCKMILNGDLQQIDKFKNKQDSGLYDVINRLHNLNDIGIFEFDENDIVRNPLITEILKRYY